MQRPTDGSDTVGTGAPSADARTVGADDKAVIAVFGDIDSAQAAVERLADACFPVERISIIGKDLQSETRINGLVTTGEIAGQSAATGAWVGGLLGLLAGTALLFIPGAGPLIVLGPRPPWLPAPVMTTAKTETAHRLLAERRTITEVAGIVGVARTTVYRQLDEAARAFNQVRLTE